MILITLIFFQSIIDWNWDVGWHVTGKNAFASISQHNITLKSYFLAILDIFIRKYQIQCHNKVYWSCLYFSLVFIMLQIWPTLFWFKSGINAWPYIRKW